MSNKETSPPIQFVVKGEEGALHTPLYVERQVKIYPIQENELETISLLNTGVSLFCSFACAVLVYMATIAWDMYASIDPATSRAGTGVIVICALVILLFFGIASYCGYRRKNVLQSIQSQSSVKDS